MLPVMAYLPRVVHTIYLKCRRPMTIYNIPPYTLNHYTRAQILDALNTAGFPPSSLDIMAAVAVAESSWTNAIQKGQPYATTGWGTWQITPGNSVPSVGVDMDLLDLYTNARAAHVKFMERGYLPWVTYTNGKYKQYLGFQGLGATSGAPNTIVAAHSITFKKGSEYVINDD
jgi:hypothetical protein